MPESIKILGVRFDNVTLKEATEIALSTTKQCYFTTPNPEITLKALKDKQYTQILNESKLNIPDGTGILWAATYLSGPRSATSFVWTLIKAAIKPSSIKKILRERVTGTDLMEQICYQSDKKIFLLGGGEGVAEKAKAKFPKANIVGTFSGSPRKSDTKTAVEKINNSQAEVLFIAFGAPNQEKWISENLSKMTSIKLAIGVGGAFNFHAGKLKRAPKWMQKLGLEWLFRLILQPKRIVRIYNAVIKFPLTVYKNR